MFTRKDHSIFIGAIVIVTIAYVGMAIDSAPNGFGLLTLWLAPPMLLVGFFLPVIGIIGFTNLRRCRIKLRTPKHIAGFMICCIALSTYTLTLEPTASLWDCSEFIAAACKLQVPHTPGTPLSLLIGRVFTMFAPEKSSVALMLNFSSALFSALCVYLVYHITYFFAVQARQSSAYVNGIKEQQPKPFAIESGPASRSVPGPEKRQHVAPGTFIPIAAGSLASLVLLFSDTFWFSAVEAETYGVACFFLMMLVALIIEGKGRQGAERDHRLVLIGYVSGLSYCIHPMCVLALSMLPFVWSSGNVNASAIRQILLLGGGLLLVFLINRLIAIGLFEFAFAADKFVVNNVGLPYYSGAVLALVLVIAIFRWLIKKSPQWQGPTWAAVFLIAGFTPYLMLFIRSNHNPPIDETNPEDLPMIKAYMSRESYPSSPLLFGPYFDAQVDNVAAGRRIYHSNGGAYAFSGTLPQYQFEKNRSTILPRLHSNDESHVEAYRRWLDLKPTERPDFVDNLKFLFTYQLGHMYARYLMFNFAGRESDRQNADWLRPWDSIRNQSPYTSKARNQYWMLPLIAGMAGAAFQFYRNKQGFVAVLILFLITGFVLALYLNSPPVEPRERDYIYVASFIAFSIWVGISVVPIEAMVGHKRIMVPLVLTVTAGIPLLLLWQNYDDHDRSGRTFQVDSARNLLTACAPNAILFTGGDNDTFPLWYLQEVEGFRTDVRVMVLSYLNTDWYINQLRNRYYDSAPFNLTLGKDDYRQYGPNDVLYVQESIKEGIDAQRYLQLITANTKALRMRSSTGDDYTILPSRTLLIRTHDTLHSRVSNATPGSPQLSEQQKRPAALSLTITGNYATKSVLAMIDIMVSNHWKRPIYFNFTSLNTAGLQLDDHVVQEGPIYRLDPTRSSAPGIVIDRENMYHNLITKADYSNLGKANVHFNYEDYTMRIISPVRHSFNALAMAYINAGERHKAFSVMQFAVQKLYQPHLLPTFANLEAAELLSALGNNAAAVSLCRMLFDCHLNELTWQLENNRPIEPVDKFLAERAASMLAALGDPLHEQILRKMRMP